jgi:predicted aspartyl protease
MRTSMFIALAMATAATAARAGDPHCQLQEVGELVASAEGTTIVTEGKINGQPVRLTIDTGSDLTMLSRNAAKELHLPMRGLGGDDVAGVGGASRLYSVTVKSLRVGNMEERGGEIVATGRSVGSTQGSLGVRFLTQSDVEFDLPHGKVRFFRPGTCEGDQVVYWGEAYAMAPLLPTPGYELLVNVKVDGRPVIAQLDTGSEVSVLTPHGAARAGVSQGSRGVVKAGKIEGSGHEKITSYVNVFDSFSFGDETIKAARLWIADLFYADTVMDTASSFIPQKELDAPDMLLGADFFKSHRVYVSLKQRKVYVSYEGGPVFQPESPALAVKP